MNADSAGVNTTLSGTDSIRFPVPQQAPTDRASRERFQSAHWDLDVGVTFLNHGSYGAVPREVLEAQTRLRKRMERESVRFYKVDLERLMDGVRASLGRFAGCEADGIAPVPNATMGIATVLTNTAFEPGDEVLVTDHEYMSGINELQRFAARTGLRVVQARVPFPVRSASEVAEAVVAAATARTRLAIVSHITSASALIFPATEITRRLRERGIDVLVDGAHAPGQIDLNIEAMKPTYYVGSLHKWVSAPKGTAFLYVEKERRAGFRPLCLSSRAHRLRPERALFLRDFDYHGTLDYSGFLVVPEAIEYLSRLLPGGWPALMKRNHDLVVRGRAIVCEALGCAPAAPEEMLGSMATVILPEAPAEMQSRTTLYDDPLQDALVERHGVVAPVWRLLATNQRVLRLSAQAYNTLDQYTLLGEALATELRREGSLGSGVRMAG